MDDKRHKAHFQDSEDAEVDNTFKKIRIQEIKKEETLDFDDFDELDDALVREVNFLLKR